MTHIQHRVIGFDVDAVGCARDCHIEHGIHMPDVEDRVVGFDSYVIGDTRCRRGQRNQTDRVSGFDVGQIHRVCRPFIEHAPLNVLAGCAVPYPAPDHQRVDAGSAPSRSPCLCVE